MASCCCKNPYTDKIAVSCLGRCDLPKHHCLEKEDIRPGPIPSYMGWLYTAKDSPDHQLRCGWRPGHIFCPVLRRIERHSCASRCGSCVVCLSGCQTPCSNPCIKPLRCSPSKCGPPRCAPRIKCPPPRVKCPPRTCSSPCPPRKCRPVCPPRTCALPCAPRTCALPCPPRTCALPCPPRTCALPCPSVPKSASCGAPSSCYLPCGAPPCTVPPCTKPMVRIIRHCGQYNIITKPDDITNHPSGPFPLKYVIDTDEYSSKKDAKYSIEAKFNDYHFEYTSSQSSFVLDFSPPDDKCYKPCSKRSSVCFPCHDYDESKPHKK